MGAQLVVTAGPDRGMVVALTEGKPLQIGRGQQPDVGLSDAYVSRLHCRVLLKGDVLIVTDLNSAGGTYVNAEPVTERTVRVGEELQIGETHLSLRLVGPSRLEQATIAPPMAQPIEEPPAPEVPRPPLAAPRLSPEVPATPPPIQLAPIQAATLTFSSET